MRRVIKYNIYNEPFYVWELSSLEIAIIVMVVCTVIGSIICLAAGI